MQQRRAAWQQHPTPDFAGLPQLSDTAPYAATQAVNNPPTHPPAHLHQRDAAAGPRCASPPACGCGSGQGRNAVNITHAAAAPPPLYQHITTIQRSPPPPPPRPTASPELLSIIHVRQFIHPRLRQVAEGGGAAAQAAAQGQREGREGGGGGGLAGRSSVAATQKAANTSSF